jgi:quercetin dioxygenase-like cupin family protein
VKRIVTGWSEAGDPVVLFEGEPPNQPDFGVATSSEIWTVGAVPAPYRGQDDPTVGEWRVEPPIGGVTYRIATYAPGAEVGIHSTQTVDVFTVLAGEMTMLFADREIVLAPGDSVVQQATPHGWANRGSETCVAVILLLTAEGATEEGRLAWP